MTITVMIKRKVALENEVPMEELYSEMRNVALTQQGYISAEILKRLDMDGEFLIVSKWDHIDNWSKWLVSKERRVFQERIDNITDSETKFEIYSH